jgi:carnitine 3-dehydrogenase
MLNQFGPALKLPWTNLEAPELTDQLVEAMATGCEDQAAGRSVAELELLRDDYLLGVMRSLRPLDLGAGRLIAEREARIHAATIDRPWAEGDPIAAPLALYEARVEPDWVDYNGHMSEWAFLTAFGWASDKLFRYVGVDEDYREAGHTFFTVETHLNYIKEASLGEPFRVTTQVLGVDTKRLHFFHAMEHAVTGDLLCTTEQMLVHVDTRVGSSAPILTGPAYALTAIADAHAELPVPPQVGRVMAVA